MEFWEIHPMLVHFPIAFLPAAVDLDLPALGQRRFGGNVRRLLTPLWDSIVVHL